MKGRGIFVLRLKKLKRCDTGDDSGLQIAVVQPASICKTLLASFPLLCRGLTGTDFGISVA